MRIEPTQVNAPVTVTPQPLWVVHLKDDMTEVYPHRARSQRTYSLLPQVDPDQYCYIAADETNDIPKSNQVRKG